MAENGIQVIDPKSENYTTFRPALILSSPLKQGFVNIAPMREGGLVAATKNGTVCLYNSNHESVCRYQINMRIFENEEEEVTCVAVCPFDKNIVVSTKIYHNRVQKKYAIYWLEIGPGDMGEEFGMKLKDSRVVLDKKSSNFSAVKDVKFHDLSLHNMLIFYTSGDREIFHSWVLKEGRIGKFKNEVGRIARSYKIVKVEGEMVCADNKGKICKVLLDKEILQIRT